MELPNTPSPASGHVLRRRKKRSTPTNNAPGSSLSGLNRSSIRVVELVRGTMGFGFTISGQKPCLLRCIVEGSPAEKACLRPGNCLVGVNGKDVSHLAHDDVVRLIGSCNSLLRLHVADSYFSESSDDESFQVHQPRPKYPHRPRAMSKGALAKKLPAHSKLPILEGPSSSDKPVIKPVRDPRASPKARRSSWDPLMPTPRRLPRPPLPFEDDEPVLVAPVRKPPEVSHSHGTVGNPHVEIVRVFAHLDNRNGSVGSSGSSKGVPPMDYPSTSNASDRFNTQSSSGSSARTNNLVSLRKESPSARSISSLGADCAEPSSKYQAVVGYIGSVELPEIEEKKRLQTLSVCVRRLRMEKRVRSIVLLRIQSTGVSLFSSSQNVDNGPPLAFYSSSIIAFCGAYNDDRRFFGLVTCTGHNKNCSCHVFMVEPKLLSHCEHVRRARAFGIICTPLPVPKNGQVLGLQECAEFPATADPILNSILRLHRPNEESQQAHSQQRSPSEASNRLESTNSSNSDSGIGFRDDSDRTSARIYDIVEPDLSLSQELRHLRRSPVPRKRFPMSHHRKSLSASSQQNPQPCSNARHANNVGFPVFESDPNSLREILGIDPESHGGGVGLNTDINMKSPRRNVKNSSRDRLSFNPRPTATSSSATSSRRLNSPRHIEVSVLVTPPRAREKRVSMEQMTPISPNSTGSHPIPVANSSPLPHRVALTRNGTRSLDNLCSPEVLVQNFSESKGTIGSSTPALNQESGKAEGGGDDFWEFKVPQPPKPKMELNRVEKWAESIEKLLGDPCGLDIFTEFLQHEFSAENIHFYTACQRFKEAFTELTQSQRISMASTIFQRFLQNGASDPVNVDFQARCQVEKALSLPTMEMFDLPLAQVFNLLKFDCYPRFLRSDMFRDFASGVTPLPLSVGDASDSDQDSVKSHKLHQDGRRRSLLPWNIKNRSKNKHRNKNEMDGLNSDLSFIQQTALSNNFDGSDQDDGFRRQSYKLCRVILPDNSTTVLPCKPGESLCTTVQRLLEKREFHYSAFEVVSVATGKALDLNVEVSEMSAREIKVEPRAFLGIELPLGWRVGVRANPNRKIAEVLKPILTQHSMKLDSVVVYDIETEELVDVKWPMGRVDGHNVHVKLKADPKLEEITNQIREFSSYDHPYLEDDQTSTRTSSSQTSSSVFRGFLRRSSKKCKRKGKGTSHHGSYGGDTVSQDSGPSEIISVSVHGPNQRDAVSLPSSAKIVAEVDEENSHPRTPRQGIIIAASSVPDSPLSLIPSDLNLVENSRNRKPIYIAQSMNSTQSELS
ncbi:unnamed protein product [Allacma fusca]|uniref:Regulator of G-protein signaling 12 n=1 Tax=Allacma fusca TaxID=39272 RepID=A0A8J2PKG0_9HEXA|nr:unnamed protein product [Allacma fusca]